MWTVKSWYEDSRAEAAASSSIIKQNAAFSLKTYEALQPSVPRAEIVRRLQASNRTRLDAVPDLTRYPELRGARELVEARWRGLRDGAGLNDEEWAATCDNNFYGHRYVYNSCTPPAHDALANGQIAGRLGCTWVFFPWSDRGPILGNNLDSSPDEAFGEPPWPAVNEHLIMGSVSSGIFLDEQSPEVFPAPVNDLVARYCRTAAEAVEMLTRYNYFWGPCNRIVIDHNHRAAMIEKSACRIGVRWSPDGFAFITAMTVAEPAMNAYLADRRAASLKARHLPEDCSDTTYWRGADHRRALLDALLDEARKAPTLEKLRQIMQFRDPKRGYVCYNAEVFHSGGPPCEYTLRTSLWILRERRAQWWAKAGDVPSFENLQPDVTYSDVLAWDS
jgi:hypothetical protein